MTDELIQVEERGPVAHLRLNRPAKRNALSDALVGAVSSAMLALPASVRAVVVSGAGEHFCAGLDLAEVTERSAAEGMRHSRMWHAAFDAVQSGPVPVVAALHGAVVGGGFELAAAAHIRVADETTYFGLPEGQRGLFVGGGGSVRVARLIGVARMTDMMLTGRTLSAAEAERIGVVQYLTEAGGAVARALAIAERIATNAPLSNFAVTQALPMIADQSAQQGLFTESLMSAITQSEPEAKERVRAFLGGRAAKVTPQ